MEEIRKGVRYRTAYWQFLIGVSTTVLGIIGFCGSIFFSPMLASALGIKNIWVMYLSLPIVCVLAILVGLATAVMGTGTMDHMEDAHKWGFM